jgi:hypothetical protein
MQMYGGIQIVFMTEFSRTVPGLLMYLLAKDVIMFWCDMSTFAH